MHFIGNRAIILDAGDPSLQLVYSTDFTIVSLLLPILGLIIAFSVAEWHPKALWLQRVAIAAVGIVAGGSIAGMHYVANQGVKNYDMTYGSAYVVASYYIAIGVSWIVLALFYNFREKWIAAPWKRILCAAFLAGGVSAMHFTAATDCKYRLRQYATLSESQAMDLQVIIASIICVMFAIGIACHVFIARWRERRQKTRSQMIMLAWLCLDANGRLVVTSEGRLPSREITERYPAHTLDETFDVRNRAFQLIFQASHNWAGINGMLSDMKSHLRAYRRDHNSGSQPSSSPVSATYDEETFKNPTLIFLEKTVVAAAALASSVNLPLEQLGVFSDKIFETGLISADDKWYRRTNSGSSEERSPRQIEAALRRSFTFGRGKVLFITKEVSDTEATHLLNSGLRFATIHQVDRTIAHGMRVDVSTFDSYFSDLKRYNESLHIPDKYGTWLSFFALLPKPHGQGFDIVVKKANNDQLPDVKISDNELQENEKSLLDKLDAKQVHEVLDLLEDRTGRLTELPSDDLSFMATLRQAIVQLIAPFPQEWIREARFWARPLVAHYANRLVTGSPVTMLYAFTVMGDVHASIDRSDALARIPKNFFDIRHRVYAGSPDHAIFARDMRDTFNSIFAKRQIKRKHESRHNLPKLSISFSGIPMQKMRKHSTTPGRESSRTTSGGISRVSTNTPPVCVSVETPGVSPKRSHHSISPISAVERQRHSPSLGGIHVQRDMFVKVDNRSERSDVSPVGRRVAASGDKAEVTFVDELTAITLERFKPASSGAGSR